MERVLREKVGPVACLLLILTVGILFGVTTVTAQESDAIEPDQGFTIVNILEGQTASVTVSQTTSFSAHTVFVTSIGNSTLTASLTPKTYPPTSPLTSGSGWWTVMVIGARSRTFIDYSFGLVPWTGTAATVDIPSPGVGLVIATQFYSQMPADDNVGGYSLSIRP